MVVTVNMTDADAFSPKIAPFYPRTKEINDFGRLRSSTRACQPVLVGHTHTQVLTNMALSSEHWLCDTHIHVYLCVHNGCPHSR